MVWRFKMSKCSEKVENAFKSRIKDIKALFEAKDNYVEDLGYLNEYGLCIDFVEAGTFRDQRASYWRYQLSYGGPSEEFRIYGNGDVEFWYLDWFDGAPTKVTGDEAYIIKEIVSWNFPEVLE